MNRKVELNVIESFEFLYEQLRMFSPVDNSLSDRIIMLIKIKKSQEEFKKKKIKEERIKIVSLAKEMEKDRNSIGSWIKKYGVGGYKGLMKKNYDNIKRNKKREGWVVTNELSEKINELLNNPNNIYISKYELFQELRYNFPICELNKWAFYKHLATIISNKEFKELMHSKIQ